MRMDVTFSESDQSFVPGFDEIQNVSGGGYVKSVNGIEPDEDGNVLLEGAMSDVEVSELIAVLQ